MEDDSFVEEDEYCFRNGDFACVFIRNARMRVGVKRNERGRNDVECYCSMTEDGLPNNDGCPYYVEITMKVLNRR